MSKYEKLWKYVQSTGKSSFTLTFDEIEAVAGFFPDHSFLIHKKELTRYGYAVGKISLKNKTVVFDAISKNKVLILYVHGKGGDIKEAERFKSIFDFCDVTGLDYKSETPWDAENEFSKLFDEATSGYTSVILIANSIGAYFSTCALSAKKIDKAFFISPVVDMKKLIEDMMKAAGVTESDLIEKGTIKTDFGETLSKDYYEYAKNKKILWNIPTYILYGEKDNLTSFDTIMSFTKSIKAHITVMPNGEHWFHTPEQTSFLDDWLRQNAYEDINGSRTIF